MSGHTATPWIAENVRVSTDKCTRKDAPKIYRNMPDGEAVCQLFDKNGEAFSDAEANAAFIVTACNSHADLVRALEEIDTLAVCTGVVDPAQHRNMLENIARIARAALATLTARKVG